MAFAARKDQVDPRMIVFREEHTAVDQQQLAAILEHGHVPTDVAEAAERDHSYCAIAECGGRLQTAGSHGRKAIPRSRPRPSVWRATIEEVRDRLLGGSGNHGLLFNNPRQ